ncbi:hypothetical protein QU481_08765 [Crenobacter sp. SG2303]|uniref:Secreted protein n=1 Tax=Crenobacter oryzisoli TaxID=3056844 RepID=A0ABT7XMH3_9NEIS|nr:MULTISPECIES: hypothetical protein [unclassified Crenobacter]MDN0074986.1 hypothetical protein [Crenobacter sp. SG2303]MDN0081229.1 hypothetical protein [Crenobacter sp. SG2305]
MLCLAGAFGEGAGSATTTGGIFSGGSRQKKCHRVAVARKDETDKKPLCHADSSRTVERDQLQRLAKVSIAIFQKMFIQKSKFFRLDD